MTIATSDTRDQARFCGNCGAASDPSNRYCASCGKALPPPLSEQIDTKATSAPTAGAASMPGSYAKASPANTLRARSGGEILTYLCGLIILGGVVVSLLFAFKPSHKANAESAIIAKAEAAVRGQLKDPDSARFELVTGIARASMARGFVNSKNGFGGYSGSDGFVFENDAVVFESDDQDKYAMAKIDYAKAAIDPADLASPDPAIKSRATDALAKVDAERALEVQGEKLQAKLQHDEAGI